MSKTAVVTARLDATTFSDLNDMAERHERSRAWLVSKAVKDFVDEEKAFQAFLQEAEDQIDRGEFYTQEEMMEWARLLDREQNV